MTGEVTVRLRCLMPEKLLERAVARGARFDAVRRRGEDALEVCCDAASARLLLELCDRFSIPARVARLRGRSALARFIRRRRTLAAGLALAAALCALFLGRVWRVDVVLTGGGSRPGDAAMLERVLGDMGVRPGMPRDVDAARLAQSLQAAAGDFSYVGVRLQGVRLLVEAAREIPSPPLYDVNAARDLVSDRDGIVLRAVARSGELCVKPGDAVRRGQLLIRGEEKASAEGTRPISALGEVIVRAWFEGEARVPLSEWRTERTGAATVSSELIAPSLRWTLSQGERYSLEAVEEEYLPIGGLYVPIEIRRTIRAELRRVRGQVSAKVLRRRAAALALADAAMKLSRQKPGAFSLADSWINYKYTGSALCAQAVYEIHADAAVTRSALQGG